MAFSQKNPLFIDNLYKFDKKKNSMLSNKFIYIWLIFYKVISKVDTKFIKNNNSLQAKVKYIYYL